MLLAALVMVLCFALTACGEQDITYVLGGGTNPASAPAQYKEGEALDLSAVKPTRTGYTFDGWYLDSEFKTKASITEETKDPITVYAKWTPNTYAITYVLNGGTNVANAPTEYTYTEGKDLSAVVPTKEHYSFAGWYLDADLTVVAVINETTIEDVTLYAKWTPVDYDLEVNLNDGTISSIPDKYTYSVGLDLTAYTPSRAHYVFEGWYTDKDFTTPITEITKTDAGTVTVYAKWSLYDYTITYEYGAGDDEVAHDGAIGSYNFGTVITVEQLGTPTRAGYVFAGWYTDADLTIAASGITADMGEDVTLYAKWTPIYKISYVISGTLTDKPEYGVVGTELDLSGLVPTKRGYEFKGWYTDSDYTTPITAIPATQTEDITLYAKLDKAVYTITYVLPDGVTVPDDAPKSYTFGEGANILTQLPTPVGDKMEFAGWYVDEELSTLVESALTVQSTMDITLYPKMTPVSFAINYNYKNDTIISTLDENAPTRYYYGTGVAELPTVTVDAKSKYYIFTGWYADEECTVPVTSIAADSEVDVNLYADYKYSVLLTDGSSRGELNTGSSGTLFAGSKEGCEWEIRTDEEGRDYMWIKKGTKDPQIDFGKNLNDTLAAAGDNAISLKLTLAKDSEDAATPIVAWRFRYYTIKIDTTTGGFSSSQSNQFNVVNTTADGKMLLNNNSNLVIGTLTTEPQTFYIVVDFTDGKIKAYNEKGFKIMETEELTVNKNLPQIGDDGKIVTEQIPLTEARYLFNTQPAGPNGEPALTACTLFSPYMSTNSGIDGFIRVYDLFLESGNAWEKPEIPHNITWNGLEGADEIELPATYIEGLGIAELPQPTKTRAEFKGWYTTPDFQEGTLVTSIPEDATEDITLYAKFEGWSGKGEGQGYVEYVTFGGALANHVEYEVYTEGTEHALQDATLAGYAFGGWYTDRSFAPWSYVGTKLPATQKGDVAVYANWIKVYKETAITGEEAEWSGLTGTQAKDFGVLGIQAKSGASVTAAKDEQGNGYLTLRPSSDASAAAWTRDGNIYIRGAFSEFGTEQYVLTFSLTMAKEKDTPVVPMAGRMRAKGASTKSNELRLFYINDKGEFFLGAGSNTVSEDVKVEEFTLTEEFVTINVVLNFETVTMYAVNNDGAVLMARPMTELGSYIDADFGGDAIAFLNYITASNQDFFSICTYDPAKVTTGEGENAVVTSEAAVKIMKASITAGNAFTPNDTVKFGNIIYNGIEDATQNIFNNTAYTEGYGAKLFAPAKEGYAFDGWYADAEFTTPIAAIGADATGDQNVYAKWILVKQFLDVSGETYPDLDIQYSGTDAVNQVGDVAFQTISAGSGWKTETTEEGDKYIVWNKGTNNNQLIYTTDFDATTEGNQVITYKVTLAKNGDQPLTAVVGRLRTVKVDGARKELHLFTLNDNGEVYISSDSQGGEDRALICTVGEEFTTFGIVVDFATEKIYAYNEAGELVGEMAMTIPSLYANGAELYAAIEEGFAMYAGVTATTTSLLIESITATTGNTYEM